MQTYTIDQYAENNNWADIDALDSARRAKGVALQREKLRDECTLQRRIGAILVRPLGREALRLRPRLRRREVPVRQPLVRWPVLVARRHEKALEGGERGVVQVLARGAYGRPRRLHPAQGERESSGAAGGRRTLPSTLSSRGT